MQIEAFRTEDIPGFLELAADEGWLADPGEFAFLLSAFPSGCFIARKTESDPAAGFVTALRHERSGWIGNLIVSPESRGIGIGKVLFLRALNSLREAGAKTIWLTASAVGKSLYEKHGFARIDTISRWSGSTVQCPAARHSEIDCTVTSSPVSRLDYQAWGDRRDSLLASVTGRGKLLVSESGFLVVQPCGDSLQFGPFSAGECAVAEQLLDSALGALPQGTKLCLDSPNQNHAALRLFTAKGLQITGSSELMWCGEKPDYRPDLIYGLATMGSCG